MRVTIPSRAAPDPIAAQRRPTPAFFVPSPSGDAHRPSRYHAPMAIYLDDEAVELAGTDLANVLLAAQQHLAPDGRIVVEVQVDGTSLSGDELEQQGGRDVARTELRLYSAHPAEIAAETLEQVRYRLAAVRQSQSDAADMLQQDRAAEALQKVAHAVEGWMQAQQAVSMAAGLTDIDLNQLTVDQQPVSAITDAVVTALTQMKEMLAAGDTVAMADALAYEWPEHVDAWDRLVEQLLREIEGDDAMAAPR